MTHAAREQSPAPATGRGLVALLPWLVLAFAAAAIGAAGSADAPTFYARLDRPDWAPPAWLFGPVWTVLYVLMGVSAWLVWRERGRVRVRVPIALFVAQLAVNALWSWVFFVWQSGALALVNILALDALVVATALAFRPVRPLAAALFVPYLAWIGFATALTLACWLGNPDLL